MERELVSLDWAIKRLLRSKANFDILEGFLSELLFRDITILSIGESENNQEYAYDKYGRVDIRVKNSAGEDIIIELQFQSEYDYFQRILHATSKAVCEQLEQGMEYANIKKVIHINIVYFDLGRGEDYIYKQENNFKGLHKNDTLKLSTKQQMIFQKEYPHELYPESYIIKVNNFDNVAKDTLDEWIYFLKNSKVDDNFEAKGIQKAKERLSLLTLDKKARRAYDRYIEDKRIDSSIATTQKYDLKFAKEEGLEEGLKKGEKKGMEKGMEKEKKNSKIKRMKMVNKMIKKGLDIDDISDITGLPVNEIQELKI